MKPDIRDSLAAIPLARIRRYLAVNYGAVSQLQREFEAASGKKVHRSSFTRWFHINPSKRQQPALGTYLLIEKLVKQMENKKS